MKARLLLFSLLAVLITYYTLTTGFATPEQQPLLKQIKIGAPLSIIQCNDDKVIIYKNDLNGAACVSEKTQAKLLERNWGVKELEYAYQERGSYLCTIYQGQWFAQNEICKNITQKQCSLMGGDFLNSESECTTFYEYYLKEIEGTETTLEGIIVDESLSFKPRYHFFTNEPYMKFNTGSNGMRLEGLDHHDDLNGKFVRLVGIHTERDRSLNVKEFDITGSLIPSKHNPENLVHTVALEQLTNNPDAYYNKIISVSGNLREYENDLAYAGVGCYIARYSTSNEYMPDFPSSRHLFDGKANIGVRIGLEDVGKVENPLPDELKSNRVTVTGMFVPHVIEKGECEHVIHKSGYLLTTLEDIKVVE